MGISVPPFEFNPVLADDPRWQLVRRIVVSPAFVKSDRLCSFLLYICELNLQGRADEINEINIGARLFGRPDYDPSVDGIVRSHASRMRQRLEQYFSGEGAEEPIRLLIPKGAYIPVFEPRCSKIPARQAAPLESTPAAVADSILAASSASPTSSRNHLTLSILGAGLVVACITIVYLLAPQHRKVPEKLSPVNAHPLWTLFFRSNRPATIVCADSSLAILQDLTGHSVKLPAYLNSDYRVHVGSASGTTVEVVRNLAARRYTSIVDVRILTRFYQLAQIRPDHIQLRYSRDVRPDDLKNGAVVLLGAQQSDPWVGLFEPHMNFVLRDNLRQQIFSVINRSPRADELSQYDYDQSSPSPKVYGVAALRPGLSASGQVLILEGTSMAGTEAAADFIFDDAALLPFLTKIRNPDGSLPYFEVLLQSDYMGGSASQLEIVGYRTSPD
jgi:hypothetical protein